MCIRYTCVMFKDDNGPPLDKRIKDTEMAKHCFGKQQNADAIQFDNAEPADRTVKHGFGQRAGNLLQQENVIS